MKKLLSIAILFCGLMLGKLGAEERLFQKDKYYNWGSGETDQINYYLIRFGIPSNPQFIINGFLGGIALIGDDPQIKDHFVCSGDVLKLLFRMTSYGLGEMKFELDAEEIQRNVNRWLRNANIKFRNGYIADNDYHVEFSELYPDYCLSDFYDFVAEFNLLEKMKLSLPKNYNRRFLSESVVERLRKVVDGGRFDNGELGYKTKLDDNALEDLYYEFRDFGVVKMKELSALKINHTKKLLENTCAPVEKFSYKRSEPEPYQRKGEGRILGLFITFDETRVKSLEDLNPTPQLFQFIPEQERKFIDTTSTN